MIAPDDDDDGRDVPPPPGGGAQPHAEAVDAGDTDGDASEEGPPLTIGDLDWEPFQTTDIDSVRAKLAIYLFWLFAVTSVGGLGLLAVLSEPEASTVSDWLGRLLPAEIGILGSAIGFYFGSRT